MKMRTCLRFLIVLMSFFSGILLPLSAIAKNEDTVAQGSKLSSLEQLYFSRSYPDDDAERRLSRLEKLVFGQSLSGDYASRLTKLDVAIETALQPSAFKSNQPVPSATTKPLASTSPDEKKNSSSYPRVTELERAILGRVHPSESIHERLAKMELKAFGKQSSSDDLSDRTEALEKFAHLSRSSSDDYIRQLETLVPPTYPKSSPTTKPQLTLLQKLDKLEKDVAGNAQTDEALTDRVDKLEVEVFSKVAHADGLGSRVDHLWNTIEGSPESISINDLDASLDLSILKCARMVLTDEDLLGCHGDPGGQPLSSANSIYSQSTASTQSFSLPGSWGASSSSVFSDPALSSVSPSSSGSSGSSGKHSFLHKIGKVAAVIGTVALDSLGGIGSAYGPLGYGSMNGYGGYGGYGSSYAGSNIGVLSGGMYGAPLGMTGSSFSSGWLP